jgi:integrase
MGKREAEKVLAAFVAEVDQGTPSTKPGRSFGQLLERWYEACSSDWSPYTAYQTRWMIDHRLVGLRDRAVRDLSVQDLDTFYAALRARGGRDGQRLAASSVSRVHGVVRLALEQAVRWGWRRDNPAELANPGRQRKARIKPPAATDVVALLEAAGERDAEWLTYLFLDAETGARRSELAALRLDDFAGETVSISRALAVGLPTDQNVRAYRGHIWPTGTQQGRHPTALMEKDSPKNDNSERTLALSPMTLELVEQQRTSLRERAAVAGIGYPDSGFLFAATVDGGRPLRADTWSHRFTRFRDGLGLGSVRLHDLRHFVATTLLSSGVDVGTVAGRLGHGSGGKTTLAIYSHFLREPDQAASAVMAAVLGSKGPTGAPLADKVIPIRRAGQSRG